MKLILFTLSVIIISLTANAQAVIVQDINRGSTGSNPWNKYVFKDKLIFCASWQVGCSTRLWRCNDTITSMISPHLRPERGMHICCNPGRCCRP